MPAYYSSQHQQYQQLQQQQQQSYNNQPINYNNYHHNHHQHQQNYHQPHTISNNHYQHPSLSTVFPSIYNETNGLKSANNNISLMSTNSNNSMLTGTGSLSAGSVNASMLLNSQYSSVQKQIQQDWSNREYIEVIISNIKKLTDFLNSFELSCRSKLAMLDEKLTKLEHQIDFVEAKVTKGETLN